MIFKSFDGWEPVAGDKHTAILAKFTKEDGVSVHYNAAALSRMKDKPSEQMTQHDKKLIAEAARQGPHFFKAYNGWHNHGRKGKRILVAHFTKSTGAAAFYGHQALQNMKDSPPPKFSTYDEIALNTALAERQALGPTRARTKTLG